MIPTDFLYDIFRFSSATERYKFRWVAPAWNALIEGSPKTMPDYIEKVELAFCRDPVGIPPEQNLEHILVQKWAKSADGDGQIEFNTATQFMQLIAQHPKPIKLLILREAIWIPQIVFDLLEVNGVRIKQAELCRARENYASVGTIRFVGHIQMEHKVDYNLMVGEWDNYMLNLYGRFFAPLNFRCHFVHLQCVDGELTDFWKMPFVREQLLRWCLGQCGDQQFRPPKRNAKTDGRVLILDYDRMDHGSPISLLNNINIYISGRSSDPVSPPFFRLLFKNSGDEHNKSMQDYPTTVQHYPQMGTQLIGGRIVYDEKGAARLHGQTELIDGLPTECGPFAFMAKYELVLR